MKFTVNAELQGNPNRHGKHPIFIRVTSKGERVRIGIGADIELKHWDISRGMVKPSCPISAVLNEVIRTRIADIQKYIFDQQLKGKQPSLQQIKGVLETGSRDEMAVVSIYVTHLIEQMRGKFVDGTLFTYKNEAARIEAFDPGARFDNIDHKWLKNYESHIRTQGYEKKKGVTAQFKHNSIHKAFKTLAKFFNSAIKDGVTTNYPFKAFDKPKYKQGDRTYLTSHETEKIEAALLLPMDHRLRRAALWFLLGCYSGLRFSDWQRFDPKVMVRGKDIVIRAKKNGQLVVMPIHPKLKAIIKQLPEIGPVEAEPNTNKLLKSLSKLCGIDKNITTHVARHSFAVRCAELGISIETTSELMGINVRTCAIYYKVTGTKVRKEMEKWN